MPNLVGYNYLEVKSTYAGKFDVTVQSQEYSSEYAEGAIIEQNPIKDRDYLVGKAIVKVIVSKGPRMVTIPNVYDLESNTALSMLKDNEGFNVVIKSVTDEKVAKDTVIMTEPARYEQAEYGSTVYMYVSRGPEEQDVVVPDVVGKSLNDAKTSLGSKFTVQVMTVDDAAAENTVLEQSIPAYTSSGERNVVPINQTIVLTVSSGKLPISEATITFKVPSGIEGEAIFNCYVNGSKIGTKNIDNLAYASTVSITISGNETVKVIVEAVNNKNSDRATVGEYTVNFAANTVTENEYNKNEFKKLFEVEETTTTTIATTPAPVIEDDIIDIDDNPIDDSDEEFDEEVEIFPDEDIFLDDEFWDSIRDGL